MVPLPDFDDSSTMNGRLRDFCQTAPTIEWQDLALSWVQDEKPSTIDDQVIISHIVFALTDKTFVSERWVDAYLSYLSAPPRLKAVLSSWGAGDFEVNHFYLVKDHLY